jgi:hypothetical protein
MAPIKTTNPDKALRAACSTSQSVREMTDRELKPHQEPSIPFTAALATGRVVRA